jgi:DNA (cytosine-5)-methyltransferase 1
MYKPYTLADVHKASEQKRFTYISTFAGGGGSSVGYKLAGGHLVAMNEFQEIACDTYQMNFPDATIFQADIRELDYSKFMTAVGLSEGELDILDGSPPCPPFSMAGKKRAGWGQTKKVYGKVQTNIEDLTFDFIEMAGHLKPKVIVCENVKGLTMAHAQDYFNEMVRGFESIGYTVGHKVMSASNYGVPQKRERIFFFCVRDDIAEKLNLNFMTVQSLFPEEQKPVPTMKDAIWDLQDDPDNMEQAEFLIEEMKKTKKYPYVIQMKKDDVNEPWPIGSNNSAYDECGRYHALTNIKEDGSPDYKYFQTRRTGWNVPANTLTELGQTLGMCCLLHPSEDRQYTIKEALRLMSLPDDYKFHESEDLSHTYRRIGLMVASYQMMHNANSIYEKVLCKV